jgi:hypothetical protein
MASVLSVAPAPSLRSILPGHNFADAFSIRVTEPNLAARAAAERAFQSGPSWSRGLMALRNRLARVVGLKTGEHGQFPADTPMIEGFPIVSEAPERVVLGFDDAHLDFRIVVDVTPDGANATTVVVSTLVHTHNVMGRVYLASIMPFHKLIARTLTAGIANAARA